MGDGVSGEVIHGPSQRVRVDNGLFQSRHRRHVAISDWILAAVSKEGGSLRVLSMELRSELFDSRPALTCLRGFGGFAIHQRNRVARHASWDHGNISGGAKFLGGENQQCVWHNSLRQIELFQSLRDDIHSDKITPCG